MERIHAILQNLSKPEKRYLKQYLEAFHGKKDNRLLELVELAEKNPTLTQDEASKKMYGDPKSKAFIMTKSRLLEKMYKILMEASDIPNNPKVEEDPSAYAVIDTYKQFTLGAILRKRGLGMIAKDIWTDILKNKNTTNNGFRLLLLSNLRASIKDNIDEFYGLNEEIASALKRNAVEILAEGFRNEYQILLYTRNYKTPQVLLRFLEEKIPVLEKELSGHYSPIAHYHYLFLKEALSEFRFNFDEGRETIQAMIELLENHPEIADKNRAAISFYKLSVIELQALDFQKAYDYSLEAIDRLSGQIHNLMAAHFVKASAAFLMGKMNTIEEYYTLWESLPIKANPDFLQKINYLKACKLYVEKNYRAFQKMLMEMEDLYQSKPHANSSLRIFEIMVMIETGDTDFAVSKIEALRKHIAKYEVQPRVAFIYKILHQLELQSFDFHEQNKIEELIRKLSEETPWSANSFELIRFDTWCRAMLSRTGYWQQFQLETGTSRPSEQE
ncbi:MAG: hypothetical protein K1X92_09915 [Bacteroidia bacterium]|nr:hypothetical protein [Bacteroidia bacterium]